MKKAFTLIELLVVIAIIAILAAILFPVFAQAKAAAKKSTDLSNIKQLGTSLQIYTADFDDVMPSAYFHRAFNPALGGTVGGYIHWSGMVRPYVKNNQIYVSPGDKIGGHGPTCFASANNNSGAGWPGGQQADRCADTGAVPGVPSLNGFIIDDQVPRLSYTVNSAIMPRLRNIRDVNEGGIRVVSTTALNNVSGTILLTGLIDNLTCLNGQSLGTGIRNSSHRSTNAATRDTANRTAYFGENTDGSVSPLYALNAGQVIGTGANDLFSLCATTPAQYPLITYHSAKRWNDGDNYGMADSSAKFQKFTATINPNGYRWGAQMLTAAGQNLLDPITGNPVQN
jgi:prepilin-type N-terminal cleavage/methylation domain-containing protein